MGREERKVVQRFEPYYGSDVNTPRIQKHQSGTYVRYSDYAELEQQRDALLALAALKDCQARLEILVESGRGKMLDAVAEQKASAAIAAAT
jgi:hypothetical protein